MAISLTPVPCVAEGAALQERIQFQCEYYLSRENLARDAYLVSMMDKVRSGAVTVTTLKLAYTHENSLAGLVRVHRSVGLLQETAVVDD